MTLVEKIMNIYPELVPLDFVTTIRVQNDLNQSGDYIAEWNHPTFTQPTGEQLAAIG